MAKINFLIGKKKGDGTRNVSFVLSHRGQRVTLGGSVTLLPNEVSKRGNIISQRKLKDIDDIIKSYTDKLYKIELSLTGKTETAKDIVGMLNSPKTEDLEFFAFTERYISQSDKYTDKLEVMLNSLERFIGKRKILFREIDYSFLNSYVRYLDGHPCAQSNYLGLIRQMFNEAMRIYNNVYEQPIPYSPFNTFKIPRQKVSTDNRVVTVADLRKIFSFEGTGRSQLARDCYILSFCLMGMNTVDMYDEDPKIRGNKLCYHRKKTRNRRDDNAYIEVVIPDMVKPIIKKYSDSKRLFRFYKTYYDASSFNKHVNVGLKQIAERLSIPAFDFYSARHTWASIARNEVGIDKYTVNEALNHIDPALKIADVYIKRDFTQINIANKKVLDYVFT